MCIKTCQNCSKKYDSREPFSGVKTIECPHCEALITDYKTSSKFLKEDVSEFFKNKEEK